MVIKSQILAGGRGLGTFTNGLQGGVHIIKTSEVGEYAGRMLGGTLVTKQSGPAGKPVNTLLLAKKMSLAKEFYFAIFSEFFLISEAGNLARTPLSFFLLRFLPILIPPVRGTLETQWTARPADRSS